MVLGFFYNSITRSLFILELVNKRKKQEASLSKQSKSIALEFFQSESSKKLTSKPASNLLKKSSSNLKTVEGDRQTKYEEVKGEEIELNRSKNKNGLEDKHKRKTYSVLEALKDAVS